MSEVALYRDTPGFYGVGFRIEGVGCRLKGLRNSRKTESIWCAGLCRVIGVVRDLNHELLLYTPLSTVVPRSKGPPPLP